MTLPKKKTSCVAIAGLIAIALLGWHAAAGQTKPSGRRARVSEVVYPVQQIPLLFSHDVHLAEEGVDCATCHAAAKSSRSSLDNLIPGEAVCEECHDIDRARARELVAEGKPARHMCSECHPGYEPATGLVGRVRIPPPNIKYDHAAHEANGVKCRTCHGDLLAERVGRATRDHLPRMSLCLHCHDGRQAAGECITCHLAGPGGIVKTAFPEGKLLPSGSLRGADHDLTFRRDHRAAAKSDPAFCATCHRKEFCVECHNGVIKPMDFHGNDYVTLHAIDARRNRPDCSACHRVQTFCVACHSRSGVADDRARPRYLPNQDSLASRRLHPRGWAASSHGSLVRGELSRGAEHHSFQAQRNIKQCASCHRDEYCKGCHSAQSGHRVNPHPRTWRGSARCESLAARNGRLCLRCHVDMAEADCGHVAWP
jgi:hypothetical protein